jgi:hypothetical protein
MTNSHRCGGLDFKHSVLRIWLSFCVKRFKLSTEAPALGVGVSYAVVIALGGSTG